MPAPANHIFLPWVQSGVSANIPDAAIDKLAANQPGFVSLPIKLVVNTDTIQKTVRLFGPSEVTGIDRQQIVRTEPRHLTTDFEPNYFPAIEFDRPDFPWLFTPAKSNAQGRLRPWLCLVVVRKQAGVELRSTNALPVLEIKAPAKPGDELPDLSESWAWVHAQVTGSEKSQLINTLKGDPARSVSRLLCPRRLDPTTDYLACVVPTFELGRKAGLDLPIQPADEQRLDPAWLSGGQAPAQIMLPVYYHWEFRTSAGGDFEELVRRLEARKLPSEVGKRPMDISRPGFKLQPQPQPNEPGTVLGLEGALRVLKSVSDQWPDATRLPFQRELKRILNLPWQIATQEGASQDPIVGPPIYGCWQAAKHEVAATNPPSPDPPSSWPPPFWLDELNLDPRNRVVAGMGTQVVQDQQEQLMTSAWEQLGDIEKVNQRLRQAQLSRAVNTVYHAKSFSRFSEESFLKIVAPAQSRVVLESPPIQPNTPPVKTLLAQKIATSFVPSNAVSAPLRRIARPQGTINRQFAQTGTKAVGSLVSLFNRVNDPGVSRTPIIGEVIWVEDTTPAGAVLAGDGGETWNWITANPAPYTGARSHQSNINAGAHQHYFHSVTDTLDISEGDKLFAYIFIDQSNVPSEVMLQWHTEGSWEHRAYWGANNIGWGVDGTESRRRVGDLPIAGGWVRIEVAARDVGLEGKTLDGMAFTLFGGRASWDRAGRISPHYRGPVTINRVSDMLPAGGGFVWVTDPPAHWERVQASHVQMRNKFRLQSLSDTAIGAKEVAEGTKPYREAARAHQEYLRQLFTIPIFLNLRTKIIAQDIKATALVSLNPSKTVSDRVLANVRINSPQPPTGDPLEPVMDAPKFPQPMYEALRDLSQDFLFPGLEKVPPNTVTLLETNAKFIESFMVGLNAEMSHELLWRGYPTDQRGTYFQQFWDVLDAGAQSQLDIPPINQWGARRLGDNTTGAAAGNKLVLLIRGELLRRYPNTVIYAVKAVSSGGQRSFPPDPVDELHPVFRGTLEPDVTFLGFNLTREMALTEPGYYFVLQQQPTEPRFGLDAAPFSDQTDKPKTLPELVTWNDLNWGHLAKDKTALQALSHVSVNKIQLTTKQSDKATWGRNSAHMAYITKQLPARVAIHATEMVP